MLENVVRVLLNADVGEGLESDLLLYPFLDQANIACGGHAGDQQSMLSAVAACQANEVQIGAHPSYPDRDDFGRSSLHLSTEQLSDTIHTQFKQLNLVCQQLGAQITYIKPHGALYNDMMVDQKLFELLLRVTAQLGDELALMIGAMPQAEHYSQIAEQSGISLYYEAFADRLYQDNGLLCARSKVGAVLDRSDAIVAQASQIAHLGKVTTESGSELTISADSLCLHGDNRASLAAVQQVASMLAEFQ